MRGAVARAVDGIEPFAPLGQRHDQRRVAPLPVVADPVGRKDRFPSLTIPAGAQPSGHLCFPFSEDFAILFLHLKCLLSGLSEDSLSNSRIPARAGISGVYTWFNPLPSTCFWVSSVFFLPFASPLNLPLPLPSPLPLPLPLLPKATCFPGSLLEYRRRSWPFSIERPDLKSLRF